MMGQKRSRRLDRESRKNYGKYEYLGRKVQHVAGKDLRYRAKESATNERPSVLVRLSSRIQAASKSIAMSKVVLCIESEEYKPRQEI